MRQEKRLARKEQLLMAAQKVFARKGYHDAGVADIVKEAGVAHGTFYIYFQSKREAFEILIDQLAKEFYETFASFPLEEVKTKEDYDKTQRVLARKAIKVITEHQDLAKIFFWESIGLDEDLNRKVIVMQDRFIELAVKNIHYGIAAGYIHEGIDPEGSASFLVGGLWNLAFRWAFKGYSERTVVRQIDKILDTYYYGILKQ
jgi:AcrR family transcriptional regulator